MTTENERRNKTKITVGELIEKIETIELTIQDLNKIDDDTAVKAATYLWDYLSSLRDMKIDI